MSSRYNLKSLRGDILKTLSYIPYEPIRIKGLLNALRPTGYPCLTEGDLKNQLRYLEMKGLVTIVRTKNYITQEEVDVVAITDKGVDVREGTKPDPGIEIT